MSKKHKDEGKKPHPEPRSPEGPEPAAKLSRKERLLVLETRVEGLEQRLADLGRVMDEAIRATISVREKAPEVRPRRRASKADPAAA